MTAIAGVACRCRANDDYLTRRTIARRTIDVGAAAQNMVHPMRTLLLIVLGAFTGGAYEAFQTFELMRIGAYSLAQGIAIILAGAVVGAIVFGAASTAYGMYVSRKNPSIGR